MGKNQMAIRFGRDFSRVDDPFELRFGCIYSVWFDADAIQNFNDLIQETCDLVNTTYL